MVNFVLLRESEIQSDSKRCGDGLFSFSIFGIFNFIFVAHTKINNIGNCYFKRCRLVDD